MLDRLKSIIFETMIREGYAGGTLFIAHGRSEDARGIADIAREKANGIAPEVIRYFELSDKVPVSALEKALGETDPGKRFLVVLNDGTITLDKVKQVYGLASRLGCPAIGFACSLEDLESAYGQLVQ